MIGTQDLSMFQELITGYAEQSGQPLESIAAALAHMGQAGRPFLMSDRPRRKRRERDDHRGERQDENQNRETGRRGGREHRRTGPPQTGMNRYRIDVGWRDGVRPGNIVGAVANEAGIDGVDIGPIRIHDAYSTIDLPEGMPSDIYQTLQRTRVSGKPLRLRLEGEHSRDDSDGDKPRPRLDKPPGSKRPGGKRVVRSKSGDRPKRKRQKARA
jgi:ATP-dependent RNA helicase DeaD